MRFFALLAFGALLALPNACLAEFGCILIQQANPAPGLQAWLVKLAGATQFTAFSGIRIEGVHQVNPMPEEEGDSLEPMIYRNDVTSTLRKYDTRFGFTNSGVIGPTQPGQILETNDGSNPAGLTNTDWVYGMGVFAPPDISTAGAPIRPNTDFMYIVIKAGLGFFADFEVVGDGVAGTVHFHNWIPEPSTAALLIAGGLSVLAVGVRKRRLKSISRDSVI